MQSQLKYTIDKHTEYFVKLLFNDDDDDVVKNGYVPKKKQKLTYSRRKMDNFPLLR